MVGIRVATIRDHLTQVAAPSPRGGHPMSSSGTSG